VLFGGTDLTFAVAERVATHVVGVLSIPREYHVSFQPDGAQNSRFADMGAWATQRNIPHAEWTNTDDAIEFVDACQAEWGVAAGWYYMLPARLLDRFPLGVAGLHASLLPRLRGNSPLGWAIVTGASETGVSMFRLTPGLDDGPLYGQERFPVGPRDTVADLIARTEEASLRLIETAVDAHVAGVVTLVEQVGEPTFALARTDRDGRIDWSRSAEDVDRLVRATTRPYPGAWTTLDGATVRVWAGEPFRRIVLGQPGQVWRSPDGDVVIVCGSGAYRIDEAGVDNGDALARLKKASQRHLDQAAPARGLATGGPT
jgi:methionyl-tRNA formyltransferase